MISTIVWNCRGMGSRATRLHLKELLNSHKPGILALLEPRVHSSCILQFLYTTEFTDMLVVEAMGFIGGIWLLWDCQKITIESITLENQIINVVVKELMGQHWLLSVVYASPRPLERDVLWAYLRQIGVVVNIPWLLIGDVNQPLNSCDKQGGQPLNQRLANSLRDNIDVCCFLDLGFQGSQFTWSNGRLGSANIRERLDRAWCNLEWRLQYSGAIISHLLRAGSDHHPLLLADPSTTPRPKFLGFRFLEVWFQHPDFGKKVEELWEKEPNNIEITMNLFKERLWKWNVESFGNIFWRKKRVQARLMGIQQVLPTQPKQSLHRLEHKLLQELDELLKQEELY